MHLLVDGIKKRRRFEPTHLHQRALFDAFHFVAQHAALHADDKRASAYVSIRQHTSAYVSYLHAHHKLPLKNQHDHSGLHTTARELLTLAQSHDVAFALHLRRTHTAVIHAYVSIRQHTSAYVRIRPHTSAYVCIRQHASAYVSIRLHTSAYLQHTSACIHQHTSEYLSTSCVDLNGCCFMHTSAYISIRQHMSACIHQHTSVYFRTSCGDLKGCCFMHSHMSAYVSLHTSAYVSIRHHLLRGLEGLQLHSFFRQPQLASGVEEQAQLL